MALGKKAIMGIGTLIVFIATILVAAVAAGVIISTSGVLQQKALIIGEQAQNRLINGIEVTHIFVEGNTTAKTANNFEVLTRPEPAAGPVNFKTTSVSFFTDEGAYSASLEHPSMVTNNVTVTAAVTTAAFVSFNDADGDGISESVIFRSDGGTGNDSLQFNFSSKGLSDNISIGRDASAWTGQTVNISDVPIIGNGDVFGYFHITDSSVSSNNQVDANTLRVTDMFEGDCTFDKVIPETRYCLVTMAGQDDWYLEYGETVFIYFRVKPQNVLLENDEFEFKIFPQDGRSTYILDRIPGVIYKRRINVYP
jgi:archaellin